MLIICESGILARLNGVILLIHILRWYLAHYWFGLKGSKSLLSYVWHLDKDGWKDGRLALAGHSPSLSPMVEVLLIWSPQQVTGFLTWQLRVLRASGSRDKKWELPVSERSSRLVKAIREPT